jgi:hypothetical protein
MTTSEPDDDLDIPGFLDRRNEATPRPASPKGWRAHLKVHPAADLFPLMALDELKALGEDIKKNGLQQPIMLWAAGESGGPKMGSSRIGADFQLLDGRNRLDAAELGGLLSFDPKRGLVIEGAGPVAAHYVFEFRSAFEAGTGKRSRIAWVDPFVFVLSANIHRRHLTPEQRRDLIAKLLKATPEKSDRQIAATTKASPTTVGKVRAKLQAKGDVSRLDTRTDTKGRKQPVKKKRRTADDFVADMKVKATKGKAAKPIPQQPPPVTVSWPPEATSAVVARVVLTALVEKHHAALREALVQFIEGEA